MIDPAISPGSFVGCPRDFLSSEREPKYGSWINNVMIRLVLGFLDNY